MFSGVALVARRGHPEIVRCYDVAGKPCAGGGANARFRIASITKTFTAAAIELLEQRHRIAFADTLDRYMPTFPNGRNITIRMLLLHMAGLADPDYPQFSSRRSSIDELVGSIASQKPLFSPGTHQRYSNAGYIILAKVIEVVSRKPYAQFLKDELFMPLALSNTLANNESTPIARRVPAYVPGPPPTYVAPAPFVSSDVFVGSGILLSSAHDLVRWAQLVASGRPMDTSKLEYPYGWGVRHYFGDNVIEQSGEITGAISYLAHYRNRAMTVVVLSNLETGPNDRIGLALGSIAAGTPVEAPSFPKLYDGARVSAGVGYYSSDVGRLHLREHDGNLFAQWDGAPDDQYLQPIGPAAFFVRADSSTITIESSTRFSRNWGDAKPVEFTATGPD
jgi:D-alanyl-D-alanine carboxypeptidase